MIVDEAHYLRAKISTTGICPNKQFLSVRLTRGAMVPGARDIGGHGEECDGGVGGMTKRWIFQRSFCFPALPKNADVIDFLSALGACLPLLISAAFVDRNLLARPILYEWRTHSEGRAFSRDLAPAWS